MSVPSSILSVSRKLALTGAMTLGLVTAAEATIVEVQTNLGNFQINLFDFDPEVKPTVDNFLNYVNGAEGYGLYQNTLIHRSVKDFVVQTGGFNLTEELSSQSIKNGPVLLNKPLYSNREGTVAMAKGRAINSATNQWYVNMKNNSVPLDTSVGGYTVFGQVIIGMDVLREINSLPTYSMGIGFEEFPLLGYSIDDANNKTPLVRDNFVVIENIVVIDSNPNSAATLNPVKNTTAPIVEEPKQPSNKASGSNSIGFISLLAALFGLGLVRTRRKL